MKRSILVVDDDADVRMTLRDFLTQQGFMVHTANDGQHALRVLEKIERPSVVLLDYKMPVMDGRQFLGRIGRDASLRTIPIILLTAYTREWSGAHLEVADVLFKPVDLEFLLNSIERVCGDGAPDRVSVGRRKPD